MTKKQLLYIAIPIAFLLFLFFTRDREAEMRKAQANHPTDLVGRIMEHNAQAKQFDFGGAGNNDLMTSPNPNPGASIYNNDAVPAVRPPPTPQDDYYPPRPAPKPLSRPGPQTKIWPVPPGITPFFLPDGQPIAFDGEKVFTVTKGGLGDPLPDGFYPMFDGGYMMQVRDGKKVVN